MTENEISKIIIGSAIEVHKHLGPGLLESVYQECLMYELGMEGLMVENEKYLPISYKKLSINRGYRIDLLVEDKVVIELKTVEELLNVHEAQILTYLKLGSYKLGLLINFNEVLLKNGLHRYVNGL